MNLKTQLALEQYEADMMWTVSRLSSETTPTEEGQQVAMPEGTAVELELISDSTHDECRVLKATAKHGKCETAGRSLHCHVHAKVTSLSCMRRSFHCHACEAHFIVMHA